MQIWYLNNYNYNFIGLLRNSYAHDQIIYDFRTFIINDEKYKKLKHKINNCFYRYGIKIFLDQTNFNYLNNNIILFNKNLNNCVNYDSFLHTEKTSFYSLMITFFEIINSMINDNKIVKLSGYIRENISDIINEDIENLIKNGNYIDNINRSNNKEEILKYIESNLIKIKNKK